MLAERPAMPDSGLLTPRTTLRARYVGVLVRCKSCREADLQALVDAGRRGDVKG